MGRICPAGGEEHGSDERELSNLCDIAGEVVGVQLCLCHSRNKTKTTADSGQQPEAEQDTRGHIASSHTDKLEQESQQVGQNTNTSGHGEHREGILKIIVCR